MKTREISNLPHHPLPLEEIKGQKFERSPSPSFSNSETRGKGEAISRHVGTRERRKGEGGSRRSQRIGKQGLRFATLFHGNSTCPMNSLLFCCSTREQGGKDERRGGGGVTAERQKNGRKEGEGKEGRIDGSCGTNIGRIGLQNCSDIENGYGGGGVRHRAF